jgi:hypothetical protein
LNERTELVTRPDVSASTFTEILTRVPVFEGFKDSFAGTVYVKVGGNNSERRPFTYKPQIVVLYTNGRINAPDVGQMGGEVKFFMRDADNYYLNSWGISACHKAPARENVDGILSGVVAVAEDEFLNTDAPTDTYLIGARLINGWVVDSYIYTATHDVMSHISESHVDSDNLRFQVWWDTSANREFSYSISIAIRGPRGVPYK